MACKIVAPWDPAARGEAQNSIVIVDLDAHGLPVKTYELTDESKEWAFTELGYLYRVDPHTSTLVYVIPLLATDQLSRHIFDNHSEALDYVRDLYYKPEVAHNGHHNRKLQVVALLLIIALVVLALYTLRIFR